MIARRIGVTGAALALAVGLAACGSSSGTKSGGAYGSPSTSAPKTTVAVGGSSESITAKDFSFTPTAVQLTAGKAASITVKNDGSAKHNLTIDGLKVNVDLPPGSTKVAVVTPKAGTYHFHCEYHPTLMKGTITVG